jgi:hypothetical protein
VLFLRQIDLIRRRSNDTCTAPLGTSLADAGHCRCRFRGSAGTTSFAKLACHRPPVPLEILGLPGLPRFSGRGEDSALCLPSRRASTGKLLLCRLCTGEFHGGD